MTCKFLWSIGYNVSYLYSLSCNQNLFMETMGFNQGLFMEIISTPYGLYLIMLHYMSRMSLLVIKIYVGNRQDNEFVEVKTDIIHTT